MITRIKTFLSGFTQGLGKVGSMAGVTVFLPMLGSAILLYSVYELGPWLKDHRELGVVIFVVAMWFLSGLALMATNVLGLVGGFAFDFPLGLLAQMLGIAGAATLMYLIARRYATADLLKSLDGKPRFQAVHRALLNENLPRTLLIVTLIRLSPAMPFAVTNFLLSAAGVTPLVFIVGTLAGMLPRASALVYVGSSLTELNFSEPTQSWTLILGMVATVVAVLVIGAISKRALTNLTAQQ
jgi:uncharacterized membrane protein YdjX (TVP38/TMEM64 family)